MYFISIYVFSKINFWYEIYLQVCFFLIFPTGMAKLLSLTNLLDGTNNGDGLEVDVNGENNFKNYSVDDYMTFITSSNISGLNKKACGYYDDMRAYILNPKSNLDKLTNSDNIQFTFESGESIPMIRDQIRAVHKTGDKLKTVATACYLNAGGLDTMKDQVMFLHNHFIKNIPDVKDKDEEEVSKYELFASIDDSSKLLYTAKILNKEEIGEVLKKADEAAFSASDKDMMSDTKINEEHVYSNLNKIICEGRFNSITPLNELVVQYTEPEINIDYFLRMTDEWEELEENPFEIGKFESCIKDKTVNVLGRLVTCREELYNIALPLRFRLYEQDSTPAIDVYLQQLLGCHAGLVRAFYEICNFSDFKRCNNSTDVIEIINKIMKNISSSRTTTFDFTLQPNEDLLDEYAAVLIREWGRVMCFVTYVEIVRNTLPALMNLEIKEIDKGLDDIQPMRLYYYKGYYFCKSDVDVGYVSKCFKTLLAKIHDDVVGTNRENTK